MPRSPEERLEDIREAATDLRDFVGAMDTDTFHQIPYADRMGFRALKNALVELGEAVKALPAEILARHPEVDWKGFAGLRDMVAHQYFGLDTRRLLPVVRTEIPVLLAAVSERKFYLSNLPPRTSVRALAAAIKARWVCEQAHQQLKGELGLGHFEGRSWTGLHRHALMTCIAFAYLQHLRLAGQPRTGPGENEAEPTPHAGAATTAEPACHPTRHHRQVVRRTHAAHTLPALQETLQAAP